MIVRVTSKQNRYVKLVKHLGLRKERTKTGLFIIEGLRSLEEAVKADFPIKTVFFSSSFLKKNERYREVVNQISSDTEIIEIADEIFHEMSFTQTPQGVLAIVRKKEYALSEILGSGNKLLIVVDELQDPGNLGTIVRTAAAAGAGGMFLTKGSVDIYNPKVIRATMGGIFYLPIHWIENKTLFIDEVLQHGYQLLVADAEGEHKYYEVDFSQPSVLVIGNENRGPSAEFLERATAIVQIPLIGAVESLNASVAAGILIYESVRQRGL